MTVAELKRSAATDPDPPEGLSEPLRALWLCEAGRWDDAHAIAQEIHTPLGSWIHALLHLIEGDLSNSRYWYREAGRPAAGVADITAEWERIAGAAIDS